MYTANITATRTSDLVSHATATSFGSQTVKVNDREIPNDELNIILKLQGRMYTILAIGLLIIICSK